MRIVAGVYGGRRLAVPTGRDIRPTSDKVRGAIFNALVAQGAVQDARVLDCFCGTGALGLEALSRGASSAIFWDLDKASLALAKENAQTLGAGDQCRFKLCDALRLSEPKSDESYDLVFLDPPYRKDMVAPVLKGLSEKLWLADAAVVVVETEKGHDPVFEPCFAEVSYKVYGDTAVRLLRYKKSD